MDQFAWAYTVVKSSCIYISVIASLVAGFRIYQKWNRGDDIESALFLWVGSLVAVGIVILAVDTFIVPAAGGRIAATSVPSLLLGYAYETHHLVVMLGVVVAILGLIKIYNKVRNGDEDTYDYLIRWFGSLMFLFSIGYIISLIL